MRALEGVPKFAQSQTIPAVDYAAFARGIGLRGVNVDDGESVGTAWDAALSADRPTVLDVRCDPNVAPIPPHATFEEVKGQGRPELTDGPRAAAGSPCQRKRAKLADVSR